MFIIKNHTLSKANFKGFFPSINLHSLHTSNAVNLWRCIPHHPDRKRALIQGNNNNNKKRGKYPYPPLLEGKILFPENIISPRCGKELIFFTEDC
jgi:hypothetical protein